MNHPIPAVSTPTAGRALRRRAAAALLALGGLAGAALAQAQPAPPPPASGPMHGHHPPMHEDGPMNGHRLEHMLDRVNATSEQRTKIHAILDAARDDMRAQAPARRQLHEQVVTLLAQPTLDTAALDSLRRQMLAQHDQASQRQFKTMIDVANVLTPQQRAQIAQELRQRAAEHERRR